MGIYLFSRCRSDSAPPVGNPNPRNFRVRRMLQVGRFLVAEIVYPDSKNYEGRKILVFENVTSADVSDAKFIDPHFCDDASHKLRPIARFAPTEEGWQMALRMAQNS